MDAKRMLASGSVVGMVLGVLAQEVRIKAQQSQILTREQQEILSHLSIVQLDDGVGGTTKTIRVEGVNLQIVNGLGATNGNPANPVSTIEADVVTNGLGNLIVGYNELVGDQLGRVGSHNVVLGIGNDHLSFGGLVSGAENDLRSMNATCLSSRISEVAGRDSACIASIRSSAAGLIGCSVISSDGCTTSASEFASLLGSRECSVDESTSSVIVAGNLNTIDSSHECFLAAGGNSDVYGSGGCAIIGGNANYVESAWSVIVGGELCRLSGGARYGVIANGEGLTLDEGSFNSLVGGRGNSVGTPGLSGPDYATIVGGRQNRMDSTQGPAEQACVIVGGALNHVLDGANDASIFGGEDNSVGGTGSVVGGGLMRSALGDHDWVAGSLFEDQ